MPPEEQTKNISARVPVPLLNKVLALDTVESQTDAVIQGFTRLLEPPGSEETLKAKNVELERHIESLQLALERATQDKDNLKEMYQSHVLQVQTLINSTQQGVKLLEEKLEEKERGVKLLEEKVGEKENVIQEMETKKKKWWRF